MSVRNRIKKLEEYKRLHDTAPLVITGISPDGFFIGDGMYRGKMFSLNDVLGWPSPVFILNPEAVAAYKKAPADSPRGHETEVWEDGGLRRIDINQTQGEQYSRPDPLQY
ncbi:MAG: hypothetical protein IKA47_08280 [Oscillospiraceae bacterium]|nr:hypothetical protein [Oscillospiraceae bacterium]